MSTKNATEQKMAKRQTKAQFNHAVADSIMNTFVSTIRTRQERQGYNREDTAAYALGYLQSMMATFMVQNPQMMADVADRLNTITKEMQ